MTVPFSEAEAYLAAIVSSSDDAIISKNLDGTITSWNKAAERMYGYSAAEAVGQKITLIIPSDHLKEEEDIIRRLHNGEKIDHFETVRITRDGRLLNISLTVSPIRDSKGKIIGASKVARDITEKKRREEELRSQREWFQVTLASIGDAVIATDTDIKVTYMNPIAEKLTGWPQTEAFGQRLDTVFNIINEETRLKVEHPVDRVITTGLIQGLANHTMLISRDGSEHSIEDAAAPIRMPDGRPIGVVLVFHGIGERRILERELQRRAEMLAEKDRRKDEFLAMLAHELRNPLAPISNALHIMNSPSATQAIRQEATKMAQRQVSHMVRLLDDLLDVSRITYGKIAMQRQRVDICEIVRSAVEIAKPIIKDRQQTLEVQVPDCPLWVQGDATRLLQLFGNLLNNAAKYTGSGGHILLEVYHDGPEIVIRVRDNGIGIPPEKLPYIFDMFMQVDNSMERSAGGLGIGLTLVKNIAEMHGGSVEVYSEGHHQGTEFTVRLPILEEQTAHNPAQPADTPASQPSDSFRILVVDDNEASAKTLGWMLEMLGHEVRLAFNAKDAFKAAQEYRPQILLLDIGLPDVNGYEVCRTMRSDPSLGDMVFIAQSGWGQEQHLQRSREAGFDYHLIKPISIEALQEQLEKVKTAAPS